MKSIVAVNCDIPTAEEGLSYFSGASLRDFDITVFSPRFPYCDRVHFDGGGSVMTVEATRQVLDARSHWSREIATCLQSGKTVFVILDEHETDSGATGSTLKGRQRTYSSVKITNYAAVPGEFAAHNTRGSKIVAIDSHYKNLLAAISTLSEYRLIITSTVSKPIFTAKDGSVVGAELRVKDWPGTLVLLPFFKFDSAEFIEKGDDGKQFWNAEALRLSNALNAQFVAVDKSLRSASKATPHPDWLANMPKPAVFTDIDTSIASIDLQIEQLQERRSAELDRQSDLMQYAALLYENGKPLERAIEKALRLLGFEAEGLETDTLEIDHVITSPSGNRMIGEAEGKDTAAIDITKFRQLESNIGEDFQREEVTEPAKGVLFGNGFRLSHPSDRPTQFTDKSLINAKRLGSSLVQTSDLYTAVTYMLDNPTDEDFRLACRAAIEETSGGIVKFPASPSS